MKFTLIYAHKRAINLAKYHISNHSMFEWMGKKKNLQQHGNKLDKNLIGKTNNWKLVWVISVCSWSTLFLFSDSSKLTIASIQLFIFNLSLMAIEWRAWIVFINNFNGFFSLFRRCLKLLAILTTILKRHFLQLIVARFENSKQFFFRFSLISSACEWKPIFKASQSLARRNIWFQCVV